MNLSGESIKEYIEFYKIDLQNLIVIYDDIDIEKGIVKLRKQGGAGTHNGMKSVIEPEHKGDLINYVIGYVPEEEKIALNKGCETAKEAVIEIIKNGIEIAMNKFN